MIATLPASLDPPKPKKRPRTRYKPLQVDHDVCPGCYEARGWLTPLDAPGPAHAHRCPMCHDRWRQEG